MKTRDLEIDISISERWVSLDFPLYYIDDFIDSDFLGRFEGQYFCVYDEDATFEVALVENQIPFRNFLTNRSRSQIAVVKISDLRRMKWRKNNRYVYGRHLQGTLAAFLADEFPIKGSYREALYPEWGNKIDAFYNPSVKLFFYETDNMAICLKDIKAAEEILFSAFLNYLSYWLKNKGEISLIEKINQLNNLGVIPLAKINKKGSVVIFGNGISLGGNAITVEVWFFEEVRFAGASLGQGKKYVFDVSNNNCYVEDMAVKEFIVNITKANIWKAKF